MKMGWMAAAVMAFVGTNLDDILILTVLFAQCGSRREKKEIWLGQFVGIALLTAAGILGARAAQALPQRYICLLGCIPMAMGVKIWIGRNEEEKTRGRMSRWWQVMLLTLANGGDNIGAYVPLFSRFAGAQQTGAAMIFGGMTLLWCMIGMRLGSMKRVHGYIEKYRHIAVPALLIGLGVMILVG